MARTELRLALVIEGGVSLAVWMSGVVHEVDLLRRAGSPQRVREPQGGYPDTAFGCWQRLCDELDVDVVVDVISGTSAGGVNGAILACAAAAGHELPALKDLWLEAAQLERGKLLRKVARDAPPALLSGDYFEQQLGTAIDPALAGGPCTDGGPVTLLTTATALGEQFTVWTDTAGQPFDVADHRRVYRFRHDPGHLVYATPADGPLGDIDALFRSEPLTDLRPATAPAVTRAVRATACFPGAFEPVAERDPAGNVDLRPFRLMPPPPGEVMADESDEPAYLVDGGVLDNTPFEPLLDEFARREVDQVWRRVVGYVVANDALATSTVESPAQQQRTLALNWFPVLTSALRLPAETSFRHGVEALAQGSLDVARLIAAPEQLLADFLAAGGPDATLLESLEPLYSQYRCRRLASGVLDGYLLHAGAMKTGRPITLPSFVWGGPNPNGSPDAAPSWIPGDRLSTALEAPEFRWGTAVAERTVSLLLRHVRSMASDADDAQRREAVAAALKAISDVQTRVRAVRERVEQEICAGRVTDDPRVLADAVEQAVASARCPEVLQRLVERAADAHSRIAGVDSRVVLRSALAVDVLVQATAGPAPFTRQARFDFVRMGPDVGNEVIALPEGPSRGRKGFGEWKLYGTRLGHFGSFGDKDWRLNDFVWGRLDGAAHLVRVLAQAQAASPLKRADERTKATREAQEAVLREERDSVTAEQLAKNLAELQNFGTSQALAGLRRRSTASDAVADILRMLRATGPGVPAALPRAGDWTSAVLQSRETVQPGLPLKQRFARWMSSRWPRRRFWRWVQGPRRGSAVR